MRIYSIFGQCEAAAAEVLIDAKKAVRINTADIPEEEKMHPHYRGASHVRRHGPNPLRSGFRGIVR